MSIPRPLALLGSMAAAGTVAAALAFTPAGAAVADHSPPVSGVSPPVSDVSPALRATISVGNFGHVADRGLTVQLPVSVTCSLPGGQASVYATVRERVGGRIATADAYTSVSCTGQPAALTLRADAREVPFRRGRALVDVSVHICSPLGACAQTEAQENIYLL
jgi:hypothetical protein